MSQNAVVVAAASPTPLLIGSDISKMLRSQGPVVKCVLLRCSPLMDGVTTTKPGSSSHDKSATKEEEKQQQQRPVLVHLMDELDIDTTPKKQMVNQVLGGTFTFVGQYEDEGIVLMARNTDNDEDDEEQEQLPVNPHLLQPPLDEAEIRGDILVMKVAATTDEESEDEEVDVSIVPSNDDFFLSYTKEEYVAFASRTDVVAPEPPEEFEDDEEGSDEEVEDDDEEEEYDVLDDDEEPSDEERTGLMNLLMRSIIRSFSEENGRGPNTAELLDIRRALATKLGIAIADVPSFDEPVATKKRPTEQSSNIPCSPYKSILTKRRKDVEDDEEEVEPPTKKVKFGHEHMVATFAITEEEEKKVE